MYYVRLASYQTISPCIIFNSPRTLQFKWSFQLFPTKTSKFHIPIPHVEGAWLPQTFQEYEFYPYIYLKTFTKYLNVPPKLFIFLNLPSAFQKFFSHAECMYIFMWNWTHCLLSISHMQSCKKIHWLMCMISYNFSCIHCLDNLTSE